MKGFSSLLRFERKLFCAPFPLFVYICAAVILLCLLAILTYGYFPINNTASSTEDMMQKYAAELESLREHLAAYEDPSLAQGPLLGEEERKGLLAREKILTVYLESGLCEDNYFSVDDTPEDIDALFNDAASRGGALSAHMIVALAFAVVCAIKGIARMCGICGAQAKTRLLCDRSRREIVAAGFVWDGALSGILAIFVAVMSGIFAAADGINGIFVVNGADVAVISVHEALFFQLIALLALGAAAYMSGCLCASISSKARGFVAFVAAILFWGACVGIGYAFDCVVDDGVHVLLDIPMTGIAFSLAGARCATYWIHLALCIVTAALCGLGAAKRYLRIPIK